MKTILVVDDEQGICDVLSDVLADEGYRVLTAGDGIDALATLRREAVDCMLLDVWLPGRGGMDVLSDAREAHPDLPVIIISGHGSIDMAVRAVKRGAFDFLEKPLSLDRITTVVRNAIEMGDLRRENVRLKKVRPPEVDLVGSGPAITEVRRLIAQAATGDSRVLISGENGTGKELVARAIHYRSARAERPFVAVNCAAIPDTLIESELFGHVRGSFTGADRDRVGRFEQADGGTLFLDEIGDMSLAAQAKVLRAVQEMRFERVGGEETIGVDVRVIAATNRDLARASDEGSFRVDLLYRLSVIPIYVPPLRNRVEDIRELLDRFLRQVQPADGAAPPTIPDETIARLQAYEWPGNVRELKNFAERVTILSHGDRVLPDEAVRLLGIGSIPAEGSAIDEFLEAPLTEARERFERAYLVEKLREHEFNVTRTAQAIGIYPSSLHAKIRKYGINTGQ